MLSKLFRSSRYNKTNFKAGYCKGPKLLANKQNTASYPDHFLAPRKLDFRDMCIKTSDQESTPHCAGYAIAGMIEVQNWKKKHYPEQVDGDAIYLESKRIDGDPYEGTSLDSAARAAINLKLIDGKIKFVETSFSGIKFCIHSYTTFTAGFMVTDEWNNVDRKTGRIPEFENSVNLGGHAVLVCGYDEDGVYIQNSWGPTWGIHGFALVPWDTVTTQFMYGIVII